MVTVYLVHPCVAALEREAVEGLAVALRRAGHEVTASWTQAGVAGGRVAALDAAAAVADRVLIIDPHGWWTRGTSDDSWELALRRRLASCVCAQIERFTVVVGSSRAGCSSMGSLAEIPCFVLPEQWPALLEHLGRPRVEPEPRLEDHLLLPPAHIENELLLARLDEAVAAALGAGGGLVWICGAPGSGKSVLLAAWLARRAAAGAPVACHRAQAGLEWTLDPSYVLARLGLSELGAEGLRRREEPLIVALDGLEQIIHSLDPVGVELLREALLGVPRGSVLVATSRLLGHAPKYAPKINLDVGADRATQGELAGELIARAQLGPWAEVITQAAEGNPGIASALIDQHRTGDRPEQPPAQYVVPLPRAVVAELERDWTQMLSRVGQPRALVAGLSVLRAAGEPLPSSLLGAALSTEEHASLLRWASEWLRVEFDGVEGGGVHTGLFHSFARRFLHAELDLDDPEPHLRLTAAIDRLRRRGELDEPARSYAKRREREHRLAGHGLAAHGRTSALGDSSVTVVADLERFAAEGVLESRLSLALAANPDDVLRPAIEGARDIARRHRVALEHDPASLPGRLWTELVGRGMSAASVEASYVWGSASPPIRLRNQLERVDRCTRVFEGHEEQPRGCAIDASASRAITVSGDRKLLLWSVSSGELLETLELDGWASACAMSLDGTRAVVGASERVSLWDLDDRCELGGHDEHRDSITAVAVNADAQVVLSGDGEGQVIVWYADRDKRYVLGAHGERVCACAISADGRLGMSGSSDNRVKVWDLEACTCLHTLPSHPYSVQGVALSASGERGVSICIGEARVWDPREGERIATFPSLGMSTKGCVMVNDDTEIIAIESGERVFRWTIADGTQTVCHLAHGEDMSGLAATPDGEWYLTVAQDRLARVWQRELVAEHEHEHEGYVFPIQALEASADGRGFWIASGGRGVRRIRVADGHELSKLGGYQTPQAIAEFGDRVAFVGSQKKVEVYDSQGGELIREWTPTKDWLRACALDPSASRLAYAGDDKELYCSDLDGGALLSISGHSDWIYDLAWTPEGRVVSVDDDGELRMWDVDERECLLHWKSEISSKFRSVVLDSSGERAFVGGSGSAIDVLELGSGLCLDRFEGHQGTVRDLVLTDDDALLISVGEDASLRVWDVESCQLVGRFDGPFGLTSVAIVGRTLVAGDLVGNFMILDVDWEVLRS